MRGIFCGGSGAGWTRWWVGPGLRRGRRHDEDVEFGETLDFWRVVGIERGRSLLLHAEMKLPGTARLEFRLEPIGNGSSTKLTMTARFRPKGLLGILYWYSVVPLHNIVFGGMLKGIKRAAESSKSQQNNKDVNHGKSPDRACS